MALKMLIGIKNIDGTIDAISSNVNAGTDEKKLFYKFYRTPERVRALIANGSGVESLGIHISKDELNPDSKLCNKEATMFPLYIGYPDAEFYSYVTFPYSAKEGRYLRYPSFKFPNENEFYADALETGITDSWIYLYDQAASEWTVGREKKPLRTAILEDFERDPRIYTRDGLYDYVDEYEYPFALVELNEQLDAIDEFIFNRSTSTTLVSSIGQMGMADPLLLAKYNELVRMAEAKGYDIINCFYQPKPEAKKGFKF